MTQETSPEGEPAAMSADDKSGATVASGTTPSPSGSTQSATDAGASGSPTVATNAPGESLGEQVSGTSSKDRLRIGLIGPGGVANGYLIPALSSIERATFWSVCGRDAARTGEFATRHGAAAPRPVHTDVATFLADPDLDAVIIASPDKLHAEQAIAAARAGKHAFVEKPMATTFPDAQAIVAACAEANVKLAVGYHLRFHSGHKLVSELIAAGRIGKILHANLSWTLLAKEPDWRASAQMGRWWSLAALGTHGLDLLRWLVMPSCGTVKRWSTVCSSPVFGSAHDETALVNMVFDSGATAQMLTSVVMRAPRVVEIFGTEGFIRCAETLGPRGTGKIVVNGEELSFVPSNPYKGELEDFICAIEQDSLPFVHGDEGTANVALLELLTSGMELSSPAPTAQRASVPNAPEQSAVSVPDSDTSEPPSGKEQQ